ncbi:unnamed protein product [Candidula unifasciata]|uniref:Mitochondrial ribosomal protein L2 n=1 Tax=Candidula unifasciata TaxID=100452 RepID=A0A8S3YR08_9EUPU|nr:unnamed protein product [Candidula unifasciata]
MSLNRLIGSLSSLSLGKSALSGSVLTCAREFHGTVGNMKNLKSRLPKNLKLPRFRFEANVDINKYTLTPLKTAKTGGRGPDGRIWQHRVGGGDKVLFRMIDTKRIGPKTGEPLIERVYDVLKDDIHTGHIAVVAGGNRKRYILASENMKPGDLIMTSGKLTDRPVLAKEGDAYPIGSLPLGTVVHNVERLPEQGGCVARAGGCSGMYMRKIGDQCVVRMPSKREMIISQECMVTVGRVSNPDHTKIKMTKAGQNRWKGIRPKSGLWQRKTGYHGRKIHPIKPAVVYRGALSEKPEVFPFTV